MEPELLRLYDLLEQAISVAVIAHNGQKDKLGRPFILHPMRVMFIIRDQYIILNYGEYLSVKAQIVAILHDVIEDGTFFDSLKATKISSEAGVCAELLAVTRSKVETYREFIDRVARAAPIAIDVKLADLIDHVDETPKGNKELEGMAKNRYNPAIKKLNEIKKYQKLPIKEDKRIKS